MEVAFFANGNTAVFDDNGDQIPKLQKSWLLIFAEFLKEKGFDPLEIKFSMPNGGYAELFEIPDGYNWRFLP